MFSTASANIGTISHFGRRINTCLRSDEYDFSHFTAFDHPGNCPAIFSFEWVPSDVTAMGVLLTLIMLGLVPMEQAFAGFGSDTVMLLGILIMTAALIRTGVVEVVSRKLLQFTGKYPGSLLPATMLAVGVQIAGLQAENTFNVLGTVDAQRFKRRQAWTVMTIFGGALLLGSLKILALPVAVLLERCRFL